MEEWHWSIQMSCIKIACKDNTSVFVWCVQYEQWKPNTTSITSLQLKAGFENETSFTYKLVSVNHCYCVAWKTQNGHATQYTINPDALTPNRPITPCWEPAFARRHIIYSMIECCCTRMEGLIFPSGILSQSQCCSCIPHEWVTSRARGIELHLFCFYALDLLVHTVDRQHENAYRIISVTPVFFMHRQSKRYKHTQRLAEQSQDMEHTTLGNTPPL